MNCPARQQPNKIADTQRHKIAGMLRFIHTSSSGLAVLAEHRRCWPRQTHEEQERHRINAGSVASQSAADLRRGLSFGWAES